MSSKTVPQIFKILFQTGDINDFVLRGVVFSRYGQLKRSFCDKKNSTNMKHNTVEKQSEIGMAKY